MLYTLRHFDTPVLRFSAASGAELEIQIQWVTDNTALLPLDLFSKENLAGPQPLVDAFLQLTRGPVSR